MSSLVQAKVAGNATSITLDAAPTPGNLLVMVIERNDTGMNSTVALPTPGAGWTHYDTSGLGLNFFQAHSSFGGRGRMFYKWVQAGDTAGPYTNGGSAVATILAEFSGALQTVVAAGAAFVRHVNSSAISIATGAAGRPCLVIACVATRLRGGSGGTVAAGTGTNRVPTGGVLPDTSVGHDSPVILWRDDLTGAGVTIAGTQSGSTQDGYWYGAQVLAVALPATGYPPRYF